MDGRLTAIIGFDFYFPSSPRSRSYTYCTQRPVRRSKPEEHTADQLCTKSMSLLRNTTNTVRLLETLLTHTRTYVSLATLQNKVPLALSQRSRVLKLPYPAYANVHSYFREVSFHLFLEEALASKPITDIEVSGPEQHPHQCAMLTFTTPYTDGLKDRRDTETKMLGMLPFYQGQTVFVQTSKQDDVWFFQVMDAALIESSGQSPGRLRVTMTQHTWDPKKYPGDHGEVQILPASRPSSVSMSAMARLENEELENLIIGKHTFVPRETKLTPSTSHTSNMNASQKTAITSALNNNISLIQGPPGTGKTSTIVSLTHELLEASTDPRSKILIVAQSNNAVDNITEKLMKTHVNLLQIVGLSKQREYGSDHPLAPVSLHHHFPQYRDTMKTIMAFCYRGSVADKYLLKRVIDRFDATRVICTTNVESGAPWLSRIADIDTVIMDESTQCSEAMSLIPLAIPGVKKVILVGDEKQLSDNSEIQYLESSLFERLVKSKEMTNVHMLDTQYRMHPKISAFPSKAFYSSRLKDGESTADNSIPGVKPMLFVDTKGLSPESTPQKTGAVTNKWEAKYVLAMIKRMLKREGVNRSMISVITPYAAQRDLIARMIEQDEEINLNHGELVIKNEDEVHGRKEKTLITVSGITISSVDAFQGKENDIVIFSCVRSNKRGNIGFLSDPRRMNVALTRARRSLTIIGDKSCLRRGDQYWGLLIKHLEKKCQIVKSFLYLKD